MHLNMTSIKDAWGVSDMSQVPTETAMLTKPKTSGYYPHPHAIVETRPTRIDVALYDRDVITELYPHTPEYRTRLVTERLTRERTTRPAVPAVPPPEEKVEYFNIPHTTDMGMLILFTFVLLLLDKLATIWKNS